MQNSSPSPKSALSSARTAGADAPLWDAQTAPVALLPWLAWSLSVDGWRTDWTEREKRQAIAEAITLYRLTGTPASNDTIVARLDGLRQLVEWHETTGSVLHKSAFILMFVTALGDRSAADFAETVIREIAKVKPLREDMALVQSLKLQVAVGAFGGDRVAGWQRADLASAVDPSPDWTTFLQAENGEPIGTTGDFLDTA